MKRHETVFCALVSAVVVFLSCSAQPTQSTGTTQLDTSVIGKWQGAMAAIPLVHFQGVKINLDIARVDSGFSLVSRNPAGDTTVNPAIKDTSLALSGTWRLNTARDSILLMCDTSRIIDTALHILVPRFVRGQRVPMTVAIASNATSGTIEWTVPLSNLVPLAPLLGIDLSLIPAIYLEGIKIIMIKNIQL